MPDGFGGPLGPGGMGGPMMPARMAPPETAQRPMPGGAEGRTVLSSPLAERLGGPLMQAQKMQQIGRIANIARMALQSIAKAIQDTNPKMAAEYETMAAKLLRVSPPQPGPPTSPQGVGQMAQQMPAAGGGPNPAMPPPAMGGMGGGPLSPLSAPMRGV